MEEIYQEFIIDLYKNPLNFGTLEDADYKAQRHNTTCGDRIELFVKIKDGVIEDAKFLGHGCAISQASSSLFTKHIKGKKLEELEGIGKEEVLRLLKIDLSRNPSRMKCALLPLDAWREIKKKI